jgi:hypothetical protein
MDYDKLARQFGGTAAPVSPPAQPDFDALAKQFGGAAAPVAAKGQDLDALAQQFGATGYSVPAPAPAAAAPAAAAPAPAKQEESSFWGEVKKGFGTAWEGLKNLPETLSLQRSSLNVDRNMQVLNYLDRIDKGEKFGLGVGMGELPVNMTTTIDLYQRAKPEKRAELRAQVEAEMRTQQDKIMQALPAYAEYQKKLEPYRGRVPDATDIGSLKDFRDWLGFNVSAGTVQLLPIMASAYVTRGQARVAAPAGIGTTMALGETVQNRLEYILDKVKSLPPEQQAQAVQEYITATNDTNMAVALASGALDLAGPVGTIIRRQLAKEGGREFVKFATKREAAKAAVTQAPREIGEEFLTGGAQEIAQIAGARNVGEQTGDIFSKENIKRVFNAAAAEAAGSLGGSGINVATNVGQQMLAERTERLAREELENQVRDMERRTRQSEVSAAADTIGPTFDALVARYRAEGMSEMDAFKAAGADIAQGRVDLGDITTDTGRGEPSVSVPSGGTETVQPTAESTESGTAPVAVSGAPVGDAGTRARSVATPLTERVEPTVDVDQLAAQESRQRGRAEPSATVVEPGSLEEKVRLAYPPEVAEQIIARASVLTQEAADMGASINPGLILRAAEAQVLETLPEETAAAPQGTEVIDESAFLESVAPQDATAIDESAFLESAAPQDVTAIDESAFLGAPAETVSLDAVTETTPASALPVNPETGLKPKGKRGRKPVERTPEEQAAADAQRKERQKVGRDSIRTAEKSRAVVEKPFSVDDYDNMDAAKAAAMELQQERDNALVEAYRILNDRNIGPTSKAKQIAKTVIDHPSVDLQEKQRAQSRAKQTDTARADILGDSTNAQPDSFYETATDATKAIDHVIKTGNPFEKLLAQRIKPFLKGVKIVVVSNPETDIPDPRTRRNFRGAMGLYVEKGKQRTIYLSNMPGLRGINNMTFLHEALHGATMAQINAWTKDPNSVSPQARAAIADMQKVMLQAYKYYAVMNVTGRTDPLEDALYNLGAFTDLKEFVAYGMTQPEMQDFLMKVPGQYKFDGDTLNRGLLTKFVQSIRKMFNMGPQYDSAFQDLVVVTDRLLRAAPAPSSQSTIMALARRVTAKQNKTLGKIARSQSATDLNASIGELMMETRNAKDAIRLLKSVYGALSVGTLRKILPTQTTMDITRWIGDRINNIRVVNDAVQDMAGMRAKMIRELAQKVPEWVAFGQKYEDGARALGDVMHASTLLGVDPTLYPDLFDALQNDTQLQKLKADYQAALNDPNKSPKQRATAKGNITKRENELRVVYEGGLVVNPHTGERYNISGWDNLAAPTFGNGEGQRIYVMARDAYRDTFNLHQKLLIDKITKANIPGSASKPNTPKGKLIAQITQTFQEAQQLGVYFPLMRYGNHWLRIGSGKSGEFYMFESAAARNNYARKRAEESGKTLEEMIESEDFDVGDDLREMRNDIVESSQMLKDIFKALEDSANVDPVTGKAAITDVDAIKDQVYQMYLMTLPDRDIRRKFTHRQGKTGFSADVLRNFIVSQHTAANQLARLAYADQIRLGIGSAYAELAGNPDKLKLSAFVDEIAMRASAEMTPQVPGEFNWDQMASIGNQVVFYYMLTSPKSALVQMTQLPIVGLPALTAKYGAADTAKVTARYSFLFNKLGTTKIDQRGNVVTNWGEPSINDSSYVNKHPDLDYRKALKTAWQAAQDRDIFMSTYAADMTSRASVPTGKYEGWMKKGTRATLNLMGGAFHHLERITRETMYMSTFELEFARAKKEGLNNADATDRGIKAATDMVYETLFNYSQYNKPRIMKAGAIPRLATQFMSFPLQMTSYLVRNFYGMLPFLNKEEKRDAAIKFFGTLGMTGMFAGVVGLPGYSMIMGIAEGIRELLRPDMEDDEADEEYDVDDDGNPLGKRNLDLWFREWFIPNYFGPGSDLAKALGLTDEQALALQRGVKMGPISALTDLNIGASVSLDGLWFRDDAPAEDSKAAFTQFIFNFVTGPFGSMGQQVASAFDDFNNGQFNRGVEKLLPAFFRGGAKAIRQATEGEQTRQGAEIRNAEWYTTGKLLGTSLGFQSTEVAEIQKKNFMAKRMVMEIQKDRQKVLADLDLAVQRYENDPSDSNETRLEDALIAIDKYNYKNGMLAISGETVSKSLSGRAQRRAEAVEGLMVSPKEAPYVYPLLERSQVPQE